MKLSSFRIILHIADDIYVSSSKNRVRDEFRLTLHAAETLYESSIAFGNRWEMPKMPKMGKMRVALIDDDGNYHLSMSKRTIFTIFMIDIIW